MCLLVQKVIFAAALTLHQPATTTVACPCPGSSPLPGMGAPLRELGVTSRTPFLSTTCSDHGAELNTATSSLVHHCSSYREQ